MKNIKDMTDVAYKVGYTIKKNGVDDYTLQENGVITDFTKPLQIRRDLPDLASNKMYNGVPLSLISDYIYCGGGEFNPELWCYLMNKKDGDSIRFGEILNLNMLWCKNISDIVNNFDSLVYLGFLKDKEDYIEVYAYPLKDVPRGPLNYRMENRTTERFAPVKYLD